MNLRHPQRLLQPWKDLRQFTQELYAMFRRAEADAPGGVDVDAPPVRIGDQSFRVRRTPRGEFNLVPEPSSRAGAPAPESGPPRWETVARRVRPEPPGRRVETVADERRREAATSARFPEPERGRRRPGATPADPGPSRRVAPEPEAPPERAATGPVDPARTPYVPTAYTPRAVEPFVAPPRADVVNVGADPEWVSPEFPFGGGGTTVFLGKVQSGTGDTYRVVLYPDGPDGEPGEEPVEVRILVIDPDEEIPADSWLAGIFQFQDADGNDVYFAQPPIWIA